MKHVLYILEAVEGGAWRHLRDLISELHGKSVKCSVVLSFNRQLGNDSEVFSFLNSLDVPAYEIPMKRGAAPGDMTAVLKLTRLIRRLTPDIVHAHCAKAGILGRVAAKLGKVPAVYTPHCFPFFMKDSRHCHAYSFAEKGMVGITSAIIVLSREEQAAALDLGYPPDRIHLIPNGIKLCGMALPEPADGKGLRLGFFGRPGNQKGVDDFVRLVQELNKRGIVTEGSIFGRFRHEHPTSNIQHSTSSLIKKGAGKTETDISYFGGCPQEKVIETMRGLDVIVMPSAWEGLPYVLLEALDAGVPVSAYRVGGIGDVVQHGVSAMLADPGNFDELLENTADLCDAGLRRRIAEGGRAAVRDYTLTRMSEATLAVYESVCVNVF